MTSHIDYHTDESRAPGPDLAALAASGAHPGWVVLDAARIGSFTGELAFDTAPATSVYFDNGLAYQAVRAGDPTLCDRLIDNGVVEAAQIERGVVRVGHTENLGRLFDRDPSIDRDAVMVVMEMATDEVVTSVANNTAVTFRVTAYRHHASGIHRWIVAPGDPTQLSPIAAVAQIDASVTSDLPSIPTKALEDDDVRIEWDHPVSEDDVRRPSTALHTLDESILQSLLDDERAAEASAGFDPDQADWSRSVSAPAPVADVAAAEPDEYQLHSDDRIATQHSVTSSATSGSTSDLDDDFHVVWPDGSEQELGPTTGGLWFGNDLEVPVVDQAMADVVPIEVLNFDMRAVPAHDVDDAGVDVVPAHDVDELTSFGTPGSLTFEMPPLTFTSDDRPDEHQPDEVVDAVRRALSAIESVSTVPTKLPAMVVGDMAKFAFEPAFEDATVEDATLDENRVEVTPFSGVIAPHVREDRHADDAGTLALALGRSDKPAAPTVPRSTQVEVAASAPFGGFAPPTLDDAAEAVYARAARQHVPAAAHPSGITSVVFVDDQDDADRSGALRRLIGSMRRK